MCKKIEVRSPLDKRLADGELNFNEWVVEKRREIEKQVNKQYPERIEKAVSAAKKKL